MNSKKICALSLAGVIFLSGCGDSSSSSSEVSKKQASEASSEVAVSPSHGYENRKLITDDLTDYKIAVPTALGYAYDEFERIDYQLDFMRTDGTHAYYSYFPRAYIDEKDGNKVFAYGGVAVLKEQEEGKKQMSVPYIIVVEETDSGNDILFMSIGDQIFTDDPDYDFLTKYNDGDYSSSKVNLDYIFDWTLNSGKTLPEENDG